MIYTDLNLGGSATFAMNLMYHDFSKIINQYFNYFVPVYAYF